MIGDLVLLPSFAEEGRYESMCHKIDEQQTTTCVSESTFTDQIPVRLEACSLPRITKTNPEQANLTAYK